MGDGSPSQIPSIEMSPATEQFPQEGPFLLTPGDGLQPKGRVVWAEGAFHKYLARNYRVHGGAKRVLRIVPWMAIEPEVLSIPALLRQVALDGARPVLRVDPQNDRSIAFAFRIVQGALGWTNGQDTSRAKDNAQREAFRAVANTGWPLPLTAEELLPCYTASPHPPAGQPGAGDPPPGEWLYWRLLRGYADTPAETGSGCAQPAATASQAQGKALGFRLGHALQGAERPSLLRLGMVDRPRREIRESDRWLHTALLDAMDAVARLPADQQVQAVEPLARLGKALFVILCGWDGRSDLYWNGIGNTARPLLRWPPPGTEMGADEMRALAAALPDRAECEAVAGAVGELLADGPSLLGAMSLAGFAREFVGTVSRCIGARPESGDDGPPVGGPAEAHTDLPVIELEYCGPAEAGGAAPASALVTHASLDAPADPRASGSKLPALRSICQRGLASARPVARQATRTYEVGCSTLPLRYRFGLLIGHEDMRAVHLPAGSSAVGLSNRTETPTYVRFMPLLSDLPAGDGWAGFAVRLGAGMITVLPAGRLPRPVPELVQSAAVGLGVEPTPHEQVAQAAGLAAVSEDPAQGKGGEVQGAPLSAGPACPAPDERRFPLEDLRIRITKEAFCIEGATPDGWSGAIPWGDKRLAGGGSESISRKTKQIKLLAVLASADDCSALALQKALKMPAGKSEAAFRQQVTRLRRGLARVLEPYVVDADPDTLPDRVLPRLPQGPGGSEYRLGCQVSFDPDADVT